VTCVERRPKFIIIIHCSRFFASATAGFSCPARDAFTGLIGENSVSNLRLKLTCGAGHASVMHLQSGDSRGRRSASVGDSRSPAQSINRISQKLIAPRRHFVAMESNRRSP
jgi:hypothetical protein